MAEAGCLKDVAVQNLEVNGNISTTGDLTSKRPVNNYLNGVGRTLNLKAAQSGTVFNIDGAGNNIINLPEANVNNVGITYKFVLLTDVGANNTTKFVLPGNNESNFFANIFLVGANAVCSITQDNDGDTLTLVNNTVAGATVELTCLFDNNSFSRYTAEVISTPAATVDDG